MCSAPASVVSEDWPWCGFDALEFMAGAAHVTKKFNDAGYKAFAFEILRCQAALCASACVNGCANNLSLLLA